MDVANISICDCLQTPKTEGEAAAATTEEPKPEGVSLVWRFTL